MKTNEEMFRAVIKKRDEYLAQQARKREKRRIMLRGLGYAGIAAAALALVIFAAAALSRVLIHAGGTATPIISTDTGSITQPVQSASVTLSPVMSEGDMRRVVEIAAAGVRLDEIQAGEGVYFTFDRLSQIYIQTGSRMFIYERSGDHWSDINHSEGDAETVKLLADASSEEDKNGFVILNIIDDVNNAAYSCGGLKVTWG
ncbi:MAG: hypothetical protein IKN24_06125 [Lachnospiraceae bacterium]|nr:hypothetical protein [Lachnospiraceae bacterium]